MLQESIESVFTESPKESKIVSIPSETFEKPIGSTKQLLQSKSSKIHMKYGDLLPFGDKEEIKIGDTLPYGPRLFQDNPDNFLRVKDIGNCKRLLLIGVLGSFTPDCWNRHLFQVLRKYKYYQERNVDHICCISTNDPYTHSTWGRYLGCDKKILMLSDLKIKFTNLIGMHATVPWLDNTIRSRRYIILADDMLVKKIISAPDHHVSTCEWYCDHLLRDEFEGEGEGESTD